MKQDIERSILELQFRETQLVEELSEIRLQIKFLYEQLNVTNQIQSSQSNDTQGQTN